MVFECRSRTIPVRARPVPGVLFHLNAISGPFQYPEHHSGLDHSSSWVRFQDRSSSWSISQIWRTISGPYLDYHCKTFPVPGVPFQDHFSGRVSTTIPVAGVPFLDRSNTCGTIFQYLPRTIPVLRLGYHFRAIPVPIPVSTIPGPFQYLPAVLFQDDLKTIPVP